jgi:hypothetical protein
MHNGFHRSPLVPRCLKILKYIFPCAVRTAECRLSNELNRFGCAVQYNRRARADTQLWINWKVRHGSLTHQLSPEFHTTQQLPVAGPYREGKPRLEVKGAARSHSGLLLAWP